MRNTPVPAETAGRSDEYIAPSISDHGDIEIVTKGEDPPGRNEEFETILVWGSEG
jgi:hypothetical protein